MENVFLAEGKPRRGCYRVVVRLEDLHEAQSPITVRLSARIGQRHFSSLVELGDRNEQREARILALVISWGSALVS